MAELNKNIIAKEFWDDEKTKMATAMHLMGCLTDTDHEALTKAWEGAGGLKYMKWWEFVLKNVSVKYER